jgi:hypothetical protein
MPIAKMYSKSAAGKAGGDLHEKKDSHVSFPADSKVEFHLRTDDLKGKCKIGTNYVVMIPVVCTSIDEEATRLRQIGKPTIQGMQQ